MVLLHWTTVSAPTNIAVIKYWGKASTTYNTPINDSLSVTLDVHDLCAVTTVAVGDPRNFTTDRLWLNGHECEINDRFRACLKGVRALATNVTTREGKVITKQDWQTLHIHVSSYNTFPTAAGLASSAAGYAALVAALANLMNAKEEFPNQLSTIARQGSGSACRSLHGGFVAWRQGHAPSWLDSKAEQVATETHWPELRALILVVSDKQKDTSSTAGMSTSVATSPLLQHRATHIVPQRMKQMVAAIQARDFIAFGKLTMQDSNQFHATCLDTYPPIFYMNDVSRSIVRIVTAYNDWAGEIRAAYTFDAGPNAVLYVLDQHVREVAALMMHYYSHKSHIATWVQARRDDTLGRHMAELVLDPSLLQACDKTGRVPQTGDVKTMYVTRPGPGPQLLDASNLDLETGLNTYHPKK